MQCLALHETEAGPSIVHVFCMQGEAQLGGWNRSPAPSIPLVTSSTAQLLALIRRIEWLLMILLILLIERERKQPIADNCSQHLNHTIGRNTHTPHITAYLSSLISSVKHGPKTLTTHGRYQKNPPFSTLERNEVSIEISIIGLFFQVLMPPFPQVTRKHRSSSTPCDFGAGIL